MGVNNVGDCASDIGLSDKVFVRWSDAAGSMRMSNMLVCSRDEFFLTVQHDLASSSLLTLVPCSTHRSTSPAEHSSGSYVMDQRSGDGRVSR